jgi:hypothetical protein
VVLPSESVDGGERESGANGKGNFIIPGIIGIFIVIVLVVIVIVTLVKRRSSSDLLVLGPRQGGAADHFENVLFNPRERNVYFDNPRYRLLEVQAQ